MPISLDAARAKVRTIRSRLFPPELSLRSRSGSLEEREERIIRAIESDSFPPGVETAVKRIEKAREKFRSSHEPIIFDAPWMGRSAELRERMGVPYDESGRYTVRTDIAKAAAASKLPHACRGILAVTLVVAPKNAFEIGTNLGISSAYIAAALDHLCSGQLVSLEGAPPKADVARGLHANLGLSRSRIIVGDFAETMAPALDEASPVDLAFIDGFHDGEATVGYHEVFKSRAQSGSVLIYDDIDWSDGMRSAWRRIASDPDLRCALDYGVFGICVLG